MKQGQEIGSLKRQLAKALEANVKLNSELEAANSRADKNYGLYKDYERKFLEVSSYAANKKKEEKKTTIKNYPCNEQYLVDVGETHWNKNEKLKSGYKKNA